MAFYPYQSSFAGGEISPRLYGETASPFYKKGVEFSENWLHLPQGPASYRVGSEFIINCASNTGVRLIPFNTLSGPDLCLELTTGTARLLNEDGVVQLNASGQLILNNDFTGGTANWMTRGGYTEYEWIGSQNQVYLEVPFWESGWEPGNGGPLHPLPPTIVQPRIRQKIEAVAGGNYRLQVGFPPLSTDQIAAGWTAQTGYAMVGTTAGGSDIYLNTGRYNESIDTTVVVPGISTDIWVEFGQDLASVYQSLTIISYPRLTGSSTGGAIQTGMPWNDAMLPGIQYAQDIRYGMVLVHPLMAPQQVIYTGVAFTIAPISFTSLPADPWGVDDYPSCVDIWQSRLWFANTPTQPTTLWGSQVNDYEIFAVPGTPTAASAIQLTLATKGAIKWIRGKQSFLLGTELHEDTIVSATQVVSSLDAQLLRQSGYGSAPIQAQEIGDQVLFISRDQVKLRSLNFNFDTQAWLAHDISYYAQGITLPGIVDIAFARDPDNTVYTLITDGTLRMCTYDRLEQVVAWSRWRTTGSVRAICATVDPTGTTLWMAVNRNGMNFIEIVPPFTVQTPIFLDSYNTSVPTVYLPIGETQNRISIPCGPHLDGFSVGVIVDSQYLGLGVVVAGVVDLPFAGATATSAIVGLPYTATLKSLPLDGGVMYGSSQGLMKSRTKIFVRLLPGSNVPLINGQLPASRFPATPMNTNAPIPEGDWDWWVTNLGQDRFQRVTITQDKPFQCQVAAIFGRSEVTQL